MTVKIENMRLQHTQKVLNEKDLALRAAEPVKPIGVVAVCAGTGLASVFRELGVDRIVEGGQTMNPSTEDILREVEQVPAQTVLILPNNKNIRMAAEQTIPLSRKQVIVIPTRTVPEGISAMLNFDPDAAAEDNAAAITAAIDNVITMQITYAARDSDFDGFDIHEGDYMALLDSSLFGTDQDMDTLLQRLASRTAKLQKEFITIYYGQDITEEAAQHTQAFFRSACPEAEINLVYGGQPVYYYLISAE